MLDEHAVKQLSRRGLRDGVDEPYVANFLVGRHPCGNPLHEPAGVEIPTRNDSRDGHLATLLIRPPDDRGVGDVGVREQEGHLVVERGWTPDEFVDRTVRSILAEVLA